MTQNLRISYFENFGGTRTEVPHIGVLLSMSLVTVFGNLLFILAVSSDSHLHTPMYFFLSGLSFVDTCFFSTTMPKMLLSIQTQSNVMTYAGCTSQMYVSYSLQVCEISSWQWWTMTSMWPSATFCTTLSSWMSSSADCWFWCPGS